MGKQGRKRRTDRVCAAGTEAEVGTDGEPHGSTQASARGRIAREGESMNRNYRQGSVHEQQRQAGKES
eukprot:2679366-Pleurochrysis_carterae.AAC.1